MLSSMSLKCQLRLSLQIQECRNQSHTNTNLCRRDVTFYDLAYRIKPFLSRLVSRIHSQHARLPSPTSSSSRMSWECCRLSTLLVVCKTWLLEKISNWDVIAEVRDWNILRMSMRKIKMGLPPCCILRLVETPTKQLFDFSLRIVPHASCFKGCPYRQRRRTESVAWA